MAQSAIPGLDVTELSDLERTARNPNVGSAGSADAQAWRGARVGPQPAAPGPISGPAPGSAPDLAQRGLRAVRQAGASALDAVPGSLRTVGRVVGKTAMRAGPLALAAEAATHASDPDADARYAKRFGVDQPVYDSSLGDIAKHIGIRAAGFLSDVGNAATFNTLGKHVFPDMQPGAMPAAPAAPRPNVPVPAGPNPQDMHLAAGTVGAPASAAPSSGVVTRDGNSYSGSNIGAAPEIRNGDGSLRNNGTFSTMPTIGFAGYKQQLDNLRSLGPAPDANTGGGVFIPNSRAGGKPSAWYESLGLSRTDMLGLRPRDIRHLQGLAADRQNAMLRADTDTGIAGMRESGEMARANLSASTQRAISDRQVELGLRGQDITREGHMISAAGQRARLNYDMTKDQRDYATARSDKDFDQRQVREKQLQSNIEAMTMGTDSDGKPVVNPRAAAEMRQGMDRAVARLGANGVHDLGPRAEQQLMAAAQLMKTMQQNAGWWFWQPDKLKTIDPLDLTALKVMPNGDRMITRRDSKAMGQIIPARFFQTEEGNRILPGTPTNRYDILSESN